MTPFKDDNPFASMFSEKESKARSTRSPYQKAVPVGPLEHFGRPQEQVGTSERKRGPFGLVTKLVPRHRMRPVLRTSFLLLLCVVSVFALHRASRVWLISRLSDNLAAHPRHIQLERLEMLSEFGEDALPAILQTLTQEDDELGTAGYRTAMEMQARWQTSGGNAALSSEHAMMDEIASLASKCPPERRHWLATLLKQTLLTTVDQSDDASQACYQRATQLYQLLSPLTGESDSLQSPRIARQILATRQEPDNETDPNGTGQDGPARALVPLPTRVNAAEIPTPSSPMAFDSVSPNEASSGYPESTEDIQGLPGIVATPITLRVVPRSPDSSAQESLSDGTLGNQMDTHTLDRGGSANLLETVGSNASSASMAEAPLAVYDTRSVLGLLNSEDLSLRNHAITELRRRNMSDTELNLAFQVVNPEIEVRRSLVASLGQRTDIDPRPWLLWLAEDPAREIRLEAISRLGTLDDPDIESSLRSLLSNERDTVVASRIRKILGLR